jgi:hypothetical protein
LPGFAFQLQALKQVADDLSSSDPGTAALLGSPFAALGALGPDILLYTPPSQTLADDLHDGNIFTVIDTLVTTRRR